MNSDFFITSKAPNTNLQSKAYIEWHNERRSYSMALLILDYIVTNQESKFAQSQIDWINGKTGYFGKNEDKYAAFIRLLMREKKKNPNIVRNEYFSIFGKITKCGMTNSGDRFLRFSKTPWQKQYFDLEKYIDYVSIPNIDGKLLLKQRVINPIDNNDRKKLKAANEAYDSLIEDVREYNMSADFPRTRNL